MIPGAKNLGMKWNLHVRERIKYFIFSIITVHQCFPNWTQNDALTEKVWNGRNLHFTVD